MVEIDSRQNFIRLVKEYQNLVFSICLKLTGDYFAAEDLTQETFLSAYRHINQFDGKDEKAWICRIASNKCIDYQREAARRSLPTSEEEFPVLPAAPKEEPFEQYRNKEVLLELRRCIQKLKPPYDKIARMHFLENLPAKTIAKQTGSNLKTVQTQIYRAREMLKKSYRKELLDS